MLLRKTLKTLIGLLLLFLLALSDVQAENVFTIVIDAGHGGKDPGALGMFAKEKDINLSVALKLGELIKKQHTDVKVLYTRDKDIYLTVGERPKFANDHHADLFISIHVNASVNKAVAGAETYTLGVAKSQENLEVAMLENSVILLEDDYKQKYQGFDPNSIESYIMFEFMQDRYLEHSIKFASFIQNQLISVGTRRDRGVKQAGFLVLKNTAMPSVLVELGFITNKEEEVFLSSKEGQAKSALAIYNAFLVFKQEYDRKSRKDYQEKENLSIKPVNKTENKEEIIQKKNTEEKKTQQVITEIKKEKSGRVYKVQIAAGSKLLEFKDPAFKGLDKLSYYEENGLYKYTYGETESINQAKEFQKEVVEFFPGAFIVTFINGIKQ